MTQSGVAIRDPRRLHDRAGHGSLAVKVESVESKSSTSGHCGGGWALTVPELGKTILERRTNQMASRWPTPQYTTSSLLAGDGPTLISLPRVIDLGPHTPILSFRQALTELHPQLLWVSFSQPVKWDRLLTGVSQVCREAEPAGVAVAIGGRVLIDSLRSVMPYTCYGDGLRHLAAFARSYFRPTRRPRRGRP